MSQELNLENLSTAEIRELHRATIAEARRQKNIDSARVGAQVALNAQLGFTDDAGQECHVDSHGNIAPGPKPKPALDRHVVDEAGYVRELAEGEEVPRTSGFRIVDFVNANLDDEEVREALGGLAEELKFSVKLASTDVTISGFLDSNGWHVRATDDEGFDTKFRLPKTLTRDEALSQSTRHVSSQLGPQFRSLTEPQRIMVERLAASDRQQAMILYVKYRLPEEMQFDFQWSLDVAEAQNDPTGVLEFVSDPKVNAVVEEAVLQTYLWSNPRAGSDFEQYVFENRGGRLITLSLLDVLWKRYSTRGAVNLLTQEQEPSPSEADLDDLSDEQVQVLLQDSKRLRNQHLYGK
jgi:hypothetical protein